MPSTIVWRQCDIWILDDEQSHKHHVTHKKNITRKIYSFCCFTFWNLFYNWDQCGHRQPGEVEREKFLWRHWVVYLLFFAVKDAFQKVIAAPRSNSKAATKVVDDFSVEKRKMTWPENCALALPPIYAVMALMVMPWVFKVWIFTDNMKRRPWTTKNIGLNFHNQYLHNRLIQGQFLLRFWNVLVLVLVLTFASIFID